MKRLEQEKDMKIGEGKFELVLKGLDENEKKVIKAIRGTGRNNPNNT